MNSVIPQLGLGVYLCAPGKSTYNTVLSALKIGYRHVDTAEFYGNERDVGQAIRDSGIPRADIFVTSKVWTGAKAPTKDEEGFVVQKTRQSVERLGLGYIDLMLLHSPHFDRLARWQGLETCVDLGLCRHIGLSNFGEAHVRQILSTCRIKPLCNQIEVHVFLQRTALCEFCMQQGILIEAYSPLAKASDLAHPLLVRISAESARTVAQVMLRFLVQKEYVILPKSENPKRQLENSQVFDFSLTLEQMRALETLECGKTTGWDPTTML